MQNKPATLVTDIQVAATDTTYYTVPANTRTTITSALVNNTTATPRTLTVNIIPNGGSLGASNEVVTDLVIPAAGAAPTQLTALIGQTMLAAGQVSMIADAATALTVLISGYEVTIS
jgi:hypothetical protein